MTELDKKTFETEIKEAIATKGLHSEVEAISQEVPYDASHPTTVKLRVLVAINGCITDLQRA